MALKAKITKAAWEKLSEDIKKEYVTDGDGYKLDVDGIEDAAAALAARDNANKERNAAKKALSEAQAKLDEIEAEAATKSGDVTKQIAAATKKIETERDEALAKVEKLTGFVQKSVLESSASKLAGEISKSPKLLLPHITSRLSVDFDGDEPVLRVKGPDGKPLAGGIEKLREEFVANADFADIITASKAQGGRAPAPSTTGGRAPNNPPENNSGQAPVNLSTLAPKDLRAHIEARKAERASNTA